MRVLDLLLLSVTRGGYGALSGAIGGAVFALGIFIPSFIDIPSFLETGAICKGEFACGDLLLWIVTIAVIGAGMGAILGAVAGLAGKKLAPRVLGPDKEKAGVIVGGLIGGISPWAILLIWYLTSSVYNPAHTRRSNCHTAPLIVITEKLWATELPANNSANTW